MRLYQCPTGKHPAIRAPERMRKDDVRRYCLPCSADGGFLAERTAPALERRRQKSAALRRTKAQAKAERERAKWIVALTDAAGVERDLNVRAELRRALADMGYFDGWARGHRPTMDDVNITIRRGDKHTHSGRAILAGFDVWFTFGRRGGYESALRIVYHEAAHLASPPGEQGHGAKFHRILADALQKRWPWITYGSVQPRQPGGCWAMGERIDRQMEAYVRDGGVL